MHFVAPKFSGGTCQSTPGIAQTVREPPGPEEQTKEQNLGGDMPAGWTLAAD